MLKNVYPGWYAVPATNRRFLNALADASFQIFYSFAYHYVHVTAVTRPTFAALDRSIGSRATRISDVEAHRVVNAAIARAAVDRHPGSRVEGKFTEEDVLKILRVQNYLCAGCGDGVGGRYTIDHIVPTSRGGSNNPANIQLLCKPCNSSKGDRSMDEWVAATGRRPAIGVRAGELMISAKFNAELVHFAEWLLHRAHPSSIYLSYEAAVLNFGRYFAPEFDYEFYVYPSLAFGEAYVATEPTRRIKWQTMVIDGEGRFGWVKPLCRRSDGLRECSVFRRNDPDLLSFKRAVGIVPSDEPPDPWVLVDGPDADFAVLPFRPRSDILPLTT